MENKNGLFECHFELYHWYLIMNLTIICQWNSSLQKFSLQFYGKLKHLVFYSPLKELFKINDMQKLNWDSYTQDFMSSSNGLYPDNFANRFHPLHRANLSMWFPPGIHISYLLVFLVPILKHGLVKTLVFQPFKNHTWPQIALAFGSKRYFAQSLTEVSPLFLCVSKSVWKW